MSTSYTCFEDVARLSLAEAGQVLRGADANARVWAAWFLGQALGQDAVEGLELALEAESKPGVQRHLLVVLCGLGAHGVLGQRAARDPDAYVRATATRYLARVVEPDDLGAYDLLAARMLDVAAVVRANLADALRRDAPLEVIKLAAGFLFDPDTGVREVFWARIDGGDFDREPFATAIEVLESAVVVEPSQPTRPSQVTALACRRTPLTLEL
jgi:hypothetical protein